MFDYISETVQANAHRVCCEDSQDNDLCNPCQIDDLDLYSKSQLHLKLYNVLICSLICRTVFHFGCGIPTWHDGPVRLMHGIMIYANFDDFDLDARSLWLGRGNNSAFIVSTTKQAIT